MSKYRNRRGAQPAKNRERDNIRIPSNVADMGSEPQLWVNQLPNAQRALGFWATFLDFRMGEDDSPLDATAKARLLTLIRAVSWVESQHGTGSGTQPARDPMQSGNPNDSWWSELTGAPGTGDRLIGGPNAGNYFAADLDGAVETNPDFPALAKLSSLGDRSTGHDDAKFSAIMSYCWAVPILVHKMNRAAGGRTFQCGDLSQPRAVAGAVAYNGGGDPAYGQKITDALNSIGWPTLAADREFISMNDARGTVQNLLDQIVQIISSAGTAATEGSPKFFPNGIELIDIHAKVGVIDIEVKIAGPKPGS